MTLFLVVVGGAAGAAVRYVVAHLLTGRLAWGTILVNVAGSFLLGVFSGLAVSGNAMAVLGTGFCGSLTTYSSFAVQVHDHGPRLGALTVVLTVLPALSLCALGFHLAL